MNVSGRAVTRDRRFRDRGEEHLWVGQPRKTGSQHGVWFDRSTIRACEYLAVNAMLIRIKVYKLNNFVHRRGCPANHRHENFKTRCGGGMRINSCTCSTGRMLWYP